MKRVKIAVILVLFGFAGSLLTIFPGSLARAKSDALAEISSYKKWKQVNKTDAAEKSSFKVTDSSVAG
jgi:hypothetical protein